MIFGQHAQHVCGALLRARIRVGEELYAVLCDLTLIIAILVREPCESIRRILVRLDCPIVEDRHQR